MGTDFTVTTTPSDLPFTDQNYLAFKAFIELMSRHDKMHGPDSILLYQAIPETDKSLDKLSYIASNVQNSAQAFENFKRLNQQGYSIHWAVNEYGYMGNLPPNRRQTQVSRARCFAVDIDQPISLPLLEKIIDTFYPTCAVLSSQKSILLPDSTKTNSLLFRHYHPEVLQATDDEGDYNYCHLYKVHLYWQVHNQYGTTPLEGQALNAEEQALLNNWKHLQNSLAWRVDDEINHLLGEQEAIHWTDKGLLPVSQTLRVPGFFHTKNSSEPFITCMHFAGSDNALNTDTFTVWLNHLCLTAAEIQSDWDALAAWKDTKKRRIIRNPSLVNTKPPVDVTEVPEDYVDEYAGVEHPGRNEALHRFALHLFFKYQLGLDTVLQLCILADWEKNSPPLGEVFEIEGLVNSAHQHYLREKDKEHQPAAKDMFRGLLGTAPTPTDPIAMFAKATEPKVAKPVTEGSLDERLDPENRFTYDTASLGPMTVITSDRAVEMRILQRYRDSLRLHPDGETRVWSPKDSVWVDGKNLTASLIASVGADLVSDPAVVNSFTNHLGQLNIAPHNTFKKTLHSERFVSGLIKSVRRNGSIFVASEHWDAHPTFINCSNGVFDAQTGKVFPQDPNLYLTQKAKITLKGNMLPDIDSDMWLDDVALIRGKTPWHRFVMDIVLDDIDMYHYLQKIAGYCLTGHNPEELMFFFFGIGANGKSVFSETLLEIFGDYGYSVPANIFLTGSSDRSKILSQLPGKRLILTGELAAGKKWADETIKDCTGQDVINVRPIYRESFSYRPQFKVIVRGNNKPKFSGTDYGIWRRVRIVPFNRVFYPSDKDIYLREKLKHLSHEILSWSAAGYQMMLETGMEAPAIAEEMQQDYRRQSMPVLSFLQEVFDIEASCLDMSQLVKGEKVAPTYYQRETDVAEHVYPVEYSDLVDSAKLFRTYLVWFGRGATDKMTQDELWDCCESLGIQKRRILLVDPTSVSRQLVNTWCFGLRLKPAWDKKSNSGRAIYGNGGAPKTFGDAVQ